MSNKTHIGNILMVTREPEIKTIKRYYCPPARKARIWKTKQNSNKINNTDHAKC